MHVDAIARRTKSPMNPLILGTFPLLPLSLPPKLTLVPLPLLDRILRFLASNHFFAELRPSVYTNNRTSAALDTGRTIEALLARPEVAFEGVSGATGALVGFV